MNKLAEQLSTDIAIRAAQKLAALNGQMEKNAGMSDMTKRMLSGGGIGAGIGALGGLANAYMSSDDENPAGLGDYLTNALAGAGIGAGAGGLIGAATTPKDIGNIVQEVNPAAAVTVPQAIDPAAVTVKPYDMANEAAKYMDIPAEAADAFNRLRGLFGMANVNGLKDA